ncbi:MAG: hypothetical protein JJ975_12795 [Bacteroidia bacterium]|nr:hypothetical protein [Bacteroidia bacterium]
MTTNKKFNKTDITNYLKSLGYKTTYIQDGHQAYYNPRTRKELLIPMNEELLTQDELNQIFQVSKATDLPIELEVKRFEVYVYQNSNPSNETES